MLAAVERGKVTGILSGAGFGSLLRADPRLLFPGRAARFEWPAVESRARPVPRFYTPAKIARGIFGRWPLPVVNYTSDPMKAALASLVDGQAFDLVHLDSIHMTAYEPILRRAGAPIVYDWHNIESEAMRRYGANVPSFAHKLYASITARRLSNLENQVLRAGFGHVVCSERERRTLLDMAPEARIAVIENGVDTEFFRRNGARARALPHPVRGVHAAITRTWKRRWLSRAASGRASGSAFRGWRLTLAGSDPAPAVVALGGETNVEVTGTVADLRPFYQEAIAAIVPLRTGGGTRLKILEAMAAGVPVVSTSLGAEGLAVSPGTDILIADRDEDWLPRLTALSMQGDLWNRLSESGRRLVTARYDWETLGQALYETYCRWLGPQ